MVNKDFFQALDDLQTQKGIDKEYFIQSLEAALTSAYKKNFGEAKSAFVKLNPEKNSIKVYSYKTVVEEVVVEKEAESIEAQGDLPSIAEAEEGAEAEETAEAVEISEEAEIEDTADGGDEE